MKFSTAVVYLAIACFVVANWTPQDHEIFTLNDKIRKDLGSGTTFYSWLGLTKGHKSTTEEISKAYRKMSRKLHPDKYRGNLKAEKKKAEERFQRLSLVGNILRDNSLKQRYDYFLDKGFPKWKGTGYYYSRFRPGVFLTLFVVYVVVSTFQYVSLRINRKQDYKRIAAMREQIKNQAWGGTYIPPLDGSARKITAPNGKEFHVSPTGEVSLIEYDQKENVVLTLMDENDIDVNPGFKESYFVRIPSSLWNFSLGKLTGYTVNTKSTYVNPNRKEPPAEKKPSKKKGVNKGEKIELPNGKVMYKRKKN
ncbi:CIC11C00000004212 [Sungouiella intermedia]|uniref:CIC11C00000004212 n=1 Tax=Sungouiella intermedia TaxID=45354 RepID=A0A1L0DL33_9ASCO|nr:CIC11C00000004212 [[Candida] intermedia]